MMEHASGRWKDGVIRKKADLIMAAEKAKEKEGKRKMAWKPSPSSLTIVNDGRRKKLETVPADWKDCRDRRRGGDSVVWEEEEDGSGGYWESLIACIAAQHPIPQLPQAQPTMPAVPATCLPCLPQPDMPATTPPAHTWAALAWTFSALWQPYTGGGGWMRGGQEEEFNAIMGRIINLSTEKHFSLSIK